MSDPGAKMRYADLVVWEASQLPSLQVAILDYNVQIVHVGRMHIRICAPTTLEWERILHLFEPGRLVKSIDVVTVPTH